MDNEEKITLLIVVVLLVGVMLWCGNDTQASTSADATSQRPAMRVQKPPMRQVASDDAVSVSSYGTASESSDSYSDSESEESMDMAGPLGVDESIKYFPQNDYAQKFNSRNKAPAGSFKSSSYNEGRRGNLGPSNWDAYFNENNNIIGQSQTGDNDGFVPIDESGGNLAIFKSKGGPVCGSNQNCQPEDLFDVDKYLPQEANDDWFEVQPEPVSVKNRHLINITKPIGVNTIGTSLKNSSYDLRSAPSCAKRIVSPWNNSNITADQNMKSLF